MAVGARRFGTAVALATAAVFIAFFCFAGVAAAPLAVRLSTAVFGRACLAAVDGLDAAVPVLARAAVFFAGADFFAELAFFAVLVFFATSLLAAFFAVPPRAAFLASVVLAGAAFCLTVVFFAAVFFAAVFFAAVLRDAVFFAVDFLAGALSVTVFLAFGDLLDAFFLLAAAFGAAFFAEDFFAALATTNPSSVRCEGRFPQRIFRWFWRPVRKPGRNINHFHVPAQC
ncbi:MAG: hypothetical protein WD928_02750 [Gammaproteobacteria bacterium]